MFWSISLTLAESTETHGHDVAELILCRSGSGLLALERRHLELAPRRAILVAPGAPHRFVFRKGERAALKIICITRADAALHLSPAQAGILRDAAREGATAVEYAESDLWLWELSEKVPESFGLDGHRELTELWGIIGLLVGSHARAAGAPGEAAAGGGGDRHGRTIQEVCRWLDEHLDESENLDGLAARFGLSRSLLTREFRRFTGASVVEYVKTRRIQKSGALLAGTDKDISQVAAESGFSSLTYFYRQFKALYGVAPSAFRKQLLGS